MTIVIILLLLGAIFGMISDYMHNHPYFYPFAIASILSTVSGITIYFIGQ